MKWAAPNARVACRPSNQVSMIARANAAPATYAFGWLAGHMRDRVTTYRGLSSSQSFANSSCAVAEGKWLRGKGMGGERQRTYLDNQDGGLNGPDPDCSGEECCYARAPSLEASSRVS